MNIIAQIAAVIFVIIGFSFFPNIALIMYEKQQVKEGRSILRSLDYSHPDSLGEQVFDNGISVRVYPLSNTQRRDTFIETTDNLYIIPDSRFQK